MELLHLGTKPTKARKFQRVTANVKAKYSTEKVQLDTFHAADYTLKIATQRSERGAKT